MSFPCPGPREVGLAGQVVGDQTPPCHTPLKVQPESTELARVVEHAAELFPVYQHRKNVEHPAKDLKEAFHARRCHEEVSQATS